MSRTAILLLALLACPSCATTTGTIVGPVTVPIGFFKYSYALPTWGKVILCPFTMLLGPFVGFAEGMRCDVGYVQNFGYGIDGHPPFSRVFEPTKPEANTPEPEDA